MLRRRWMLTVVFMTGLTAGACSPAPSTEKAAPPAPERTACQDPRPQICTAHYDPVCGFTGEDTYKTYANACAACSDKRVSGHRPGACE